VLKIRHLNPLQAFSFLTALTLLLTATIAQAAGFRFIEAPAGADGPALKGAMWSPCSAAPAEIDLGNVTLPVVKGCPTGGDKIPLVVISHGRGGSFVGHHDIAEMPSTNNSTRVLAFFRAQLGDR
jgi:predicted dienelactone hydrolase